MYFAEFAVVAMVVVLEEVVEVEVVDVGLAVGVGLGDGEGEVVG